MTAKNLLTIREAVRDPRCPFTNERQLYNARAAAAPVKDSAGRVINEGDPELLSCFVRLNGREVGPLLIDLARMEQIVERRRLSQLAQGEAA
jgi:hypothetical protein